MGQKDAVNYYAPIFDHAESDKIIIFRLKRLVFEQFNDCGVSLWALILRCTEFFFFFLEKCLDPILKNCIS